MLRQLEEAGGGERMDKGWGGRKDRQINEKTEMGDYILQQIM